MICSKPDVSHHSLQENDSFIILASDGVWEFVGDKLAVTIVDFARRKGLDAMKVPEKDHLCMRSHHLESSTVEWQSSTNLHECISLFVMNDVLAWQACKMLICQAAILWRQNEGQYRDDITAYVIYLKPVVARLQQELLRHTMSTESSV